MHSQLHRSAHCICASEQYSSGSLQSMTIIFSHGLSLEVGHPEASLGMCHILPLAYKGSRTCRGRGTLLV